jgi:hypothetical protein
MLKNVSESDSRKAVILAMGRIGILHEDPRTSCMTAGPDDALLQSSNA